VPSDGMPSWDPAEVNARVGWAVSACRAVSAHRLVLDAGNPIPAEQVERKQAIARWKAMIDEAHRLTSKAGVAFAVEMPHTGTLAERFDQVEELLDAMDHPDIGLDYDTSHVYRSGTSIEDGLRIIGDRVVKAALRDVGEDGEFCRPGTARVHFRGLVALLDEDVASRFQRRNSCRNMKLRGADYHYCVEIRSRQHLVQRPVCPLSAELTAGKLGAALIEIADRDQPHRRMAD